MAKAPRTDGGHVLRGLMRFFALPWRHKWLLVLIGWELWRAARLIKTRSYAQVVAQLAQERTLPLVEVKVPFDDEDLLSLGSLIRAAAARMPFACECLVQAIAGSRLLQRRGIRASIEVGVSKDGGVFASHAWLICGERRITGGPADARFQAMDVLQTAK